MSGPQQQRLANSLNGADAGQVLAAADEWARAGALLTIVAQQLQAQQTAPQTAIGGQTGEAVSSAFGRSATAMNAKSKELTRGAGALRNAGTAIQSAESTHQGLGPQEAPPYQPSFGPGPRTPAEDRAVIDSRQRKAAYDAEYDRREREAKQAADHMDEVFADSSATLRDIHGEKSTEPAGPSGGGSSSTGGAGSGGGGGVSGGGGGGGGAHPGGKAPHAGGGHAGAVIVTPGHLTPGHGGTHETVPTGTSTTSWPTGATLGSSQGAGAPPAATLGAPGSAAGVTGGAVPTQSSVSSAGTGAALGGLAVGAGGGLLGAGGGSSSAAVRGAAPIAGAGGSGRTIGASAARGGAATLGRSTTIAGIAGSPTTGSRSATGSSARTTGAGAGSRSGSGRSGSARSGAAGSRQALGNGGGGAGGGGKGGGRRKKGGRTVPSDYVEEWELDDEETGPQLID